MNDTIESGSHQIVWATRVTGFTPRLCLHTEVVHVHTRNKFIHTEIQNHGDMCDLLRAPNTRAGRPQALSLA
jgi:hypothetical protein